jgi:nitrite reductase/ring-hydroxylating ferredoxin subunit
MAWTKLATLRELPKDSVIEVEHEGDLYAICNTNGEIRALSGVCPHAGGPLGQGTVIQGMIVCPWHMWEFDSRSGTCLADERVGVPTFAVKIEDAGIIVDLPEHA